MVGGGHNRRNCVKEPQRQAGRLREAVIHRQQEGQSVKIMLDGGVKIMLNGGGVLGSEILSQASPRTSAPGTSPLRTPRCILLFYLCI